MAADIRYYGVRHHGPGSARQVCAALDDFQPTHVLIEAPGDASDWLTAITDPAAVPPFAVLGYVENAPRYSAFWPFEVYSPEYQAARWAVAHAAVLDAIDLPAAVTLGAHQIFDDKAGQDDPDGDPAIVQTIVAPDPTDLAHMARMDPIGTLAQLGGYQDGEDWWSMIIEENPNPGDSFAAITQAMDTLRILVDDPSADTDDLVFIHTNSDEKRSRETMREAHMRLAIAKAAKNAGPDGRVAVICGAWHVPALLRKTKASDDRAVLKGLWKAKTSFTLVPWSASRMTRDSGYGAGVRLPIWNRTVWDNSADALPGTWLAMVADMMRQNGELVSTAAVIEANRTARALAQMRGRPMPGLGEYKEAGVSTMCFGEALKWDLAVDALSNTEVLGQVPDTAKRPPILRDLELQQKKTRLKPETLDRALKLDLRTDSGNRRSALLHRLRILGVHWGQEIGKGGSRGTFRENWTIAWKPGFEVDLLDKLHYGSTIETAASGLLAEHIQQETDPAKTADAAMEVLTAYLPNLLKTVIARLEVLSAQTTDTASLARTIERLIWLTKMGQARAISLDELPPLIERLVLRLCLNLPGDVQSLDDDAAQFHSKAIEQVNHAMGLAGLPDDLWQRWQMVIETTATDDRINAHVAGTCLRLYKVYDVSALDRVMGTVNRRLSNAFLADERAAFFAGFFEGQGAMLIFDADLRAAMETWFLSLEPEEFEARLPLLRRAFSDLQPAERMQLLQTILHGAAQSAAGDWTPANIPHWDQMQSQILDMMGSTP
ncbi:MAG: DUF5682 family protein [Pseudomonadota bacterium]